MKWPVGLEEYLERYELVILSKESLKELQRDGFELMRYKQPTFFDRLSYLFVGRI